MSENIITVLIILLAAIVIFFIGRFSIKRIFKGITKATKGLPKKITDARAKTLTATFNTILLWVIVVVTILLILPEFGVDVGPLIAGVGIGGVALGFGAKKLVQDYINGIIILFENQFNIGDTIKVGSIEGKVVDFDIRKTTIKIKKDIYYIPNSDINIVGNISKK